MYFWKCGTKNGICVDNQTYVGTSFFVRRFQNESYRYVGVVWLKLKCVMWNSLRWSYDIIWDYG